MRHLKNLHSLHSRGGFVSVCLLPGSPGAGQIVLSFYSTGTNCSMRVREVFISSLGASMIMEVDLLMQRIFVCRRTTAADLSTVFTVPPFIRHALRFHCVADCIVRGSLRGVRYQRQIVSIASCMQSLALSEVFG